MSQLTYAQRNAARRFAVHRADYYMDMASLLRDSNRKLLEIFDSDAQRYDKAPRAILSALWAQRYDNNGADLCAAWEGTLPDAELAVLRVTIAGDGGALPNALESVAGMARISEQVAAETRSMLAAGGVALLMAVFALTVIPVMAVNNFQEVLEIPTSYWPSAGQAMVSWATWVTNYAFVVFAALALGLVWVYWSVDQWIGALRGRADQKLLFYRVLRDINAIRFLGALSILTRQRGNAMYTLEKSLEQFAASTRSLWLRWRVDQITTEVALSGAVTSECFNTGMLPQEVFWRLRDIEQSKGLSQALELTAKHVEVTLLPRMVKSLSRIRWIMLLTALGMVIPMTLWVQAVALGLKNAAQMYFSVQ